MPFINSTFITGIDVNKIPGGGAYDPFTGSGAYVSGSGGFEPGYNPSADPFTGSGAYTTGSGVSSTKGPKTFPANAHMPYDKYLIYTMFLL